jgi:hypothetical protein
MWAIMSCAQLARSSRWGLGRGRRRISGEAGHGAPRHNVGRVPCRCASPWARRIQSGGSGQGLRNDNHEHACRQTYLHGCASRVMCIVGGYMGVITPSCPPRRHAAIGVAITLQPLSSLYRPVAHALRRMKFLHACRPCQPSLYIRVYTRVIERPSNRPPECQTARTAPPHHHITS